MTPLLYHGTANLERVLATNILLAHETDDGLEAVSFSRDLHTAARFARGPKGGVLVFDRRRLQARVRLHGYHMNVYGFVQRSEGASEFEERALHHVDRIDTALVWCYDHASMPKAPTPRTLEDRVDEDEPFPGF